MTTTHREHSAVLIRIAYILGNLTTNFDEAREQLNHKDAKTIQKMIEISNYYMLRDANPEAYRPEQPAAGAKRRYEEWTQGGLEDALTKIVKLIANLSTDEQHAARDL